MKSIGYYDRNAERFFQETVSLDMSSLYQEFLDLLPEKAKILDAGCGSGRDSFYFKNQGYQITAFDGSKKLSQMASKLLGQPVLNLTFQEVEFDNEFDGIWACASLLHVPRIELKGVISNLAKSLKQGGIFYTSFKYGNAEYEKDGRYFNCYDEKSFTSQVLNQIKLKLVRIWVTEDSRKNRSQEKWLNIIIK